MNPFDDEQREFLVLKNVEDQYSLWPDGIESPPGWELVLGPCDKSTCHEWLAAHWTDLRPKSLRQAMAEPGVEQSAVSD